MGNHRFKLSNMMPNAWFYKLKDMNKPTSTSRISHTPNHNQHQKQLPTFTPSRASYYYSSNSPLHPKALDTHFPLDLPRKSDRKARQNPMVLSPRIISSSESYHSCDHSSPPPCKITSLPNDIILEVASEVKLPPIITRPPQKEEGTKKKKKKKVRVVKLKKQRITGISESFAVVKNSSDPKKDFRDSMMEMIIENKLKASKDLEELLACYLSLNSNEYHDMIVRVFEEIWFDIVRV